MTQTDIRFTDILGRRVRMGAWEDQSISTYRKVLERLEHGAWEDAAEYASYFSDEAFVCFSIYRQWLGDLRNFLLNRDVPHEIIAVRELQHAEVSVLPDGSPWDARRQWDKFQSELRSMTYATIRQDADEARSLFEVAKETWRQCHDRDVDHTYALMSLVKEQLGEPAVRDMFDHILMPLFAWRYEKFDIDKYPWDEGLEALMLVACEAMRGHLVGPERTGDFELTETEDRYILRFDPCGSGGRTVRGDEIEGTPPRMEAPYGWKTTEEAHTWNHFTPGVCLYCTHCIILMEELPIDRFGYPVRVIDPPVYPDTDLANRQKCQWQMFKDPTQVPEEYYTRVGRQKPTAFGSAGIGSKALPIFPGVAGYPGAG